MKQKKKKRSHLFGSFMLCFAMVLLLGAGSVFERAEALRENWTIYDGSLRFIDRNGSIVRGGWLVDDGDLYYMGEDGSPLHGIAEIDGKTYFFDESGRMASGWFNDQGKKYYVKNGKLLTGWQKIDSTSYYFDEDGIMHTGFLQTPEGTYFFGRDGKLGSGWVEYQGKEYLISEKGILTTKSYMSDKELVILDPADGYARFNLAKEASLITAIDSEELRTFGDVEIGEDLMKAIDREIKELSKDKHQVGFVVYIPGVGGISYQPHRVFYSASTIKAPYLVSLYVKDSDSFDSYPSYYEDALYYSDNLSYTTLYELYGDACLQAAAAQVDVRPELFHDYYADYCPGDLAKLWLYNYGVINCFDLPEDMVDCMQETEVSAIRKSTGGLKTQTKAGWYDQEDGMSANDAGIVYTKNGPYIIAVMSDQPGDTDVLIKLITALHKAILTNME